VVVDDRIHGQDLIGQRGTPRSNRDRRLRIGRWWWLLLQLNSAGKTEVGGCHGRQLGRAQAWATMHKTQWGLTLHDLEDKGNMFYKLMMKETIEGEKAMVAQFGRRLATMRVASDRALASRSSSTTSPWSAQAPPWVNCFGCRWIELVWRLSSCARVWGLREKIRRVRAALYRASWSYS
jgi:hypothetical protein